MAPRLIGLFTVGFVFIAAGITAVVIAEIGPGPAELVMLAIHDAGIRWPRSAPASSSPAWPSAGSWAARSASARVVVRRLIGVTLRWMLTTAGFDSPTGTAEVSDCASPGA